MQGKHLKAALAELLPLARKMHAWQWRRIHWPRVSVSFRTSQSKGHPNNKQKPALHKLKGQLGFVPLGFSSVTGAGADRVWRRILKAAHLGAA